VKPDFIVIYDDLAASEPSTFQFMLHALKAFNVNAGKNEMEVEQSRSGATIQYLSPTELTYRQWDGFEPKPQKEFPNQWHVEASTQRKERQVHMLTLITPYLLNQKPSDPGKRLESDSAIGISVLRGAHQYVAAFRKAGVTGAATLGDYAFAGPCKVWKQNK
jgi:hypothetical protein